MRFVCRPYDNNNKPDKLKEQSTIDKMQQIIDTKDYNFPENIYRTSYSPDNLLGEGNKSKTIDKLNIYYKYKCAYCESISPLDVEHYRPKGRIDTLEGKTKYTPGYYWLAFEWSNLIPACSKCNREGGKHNKFPYRKGGGFIYNLPIDSKHKLDLSKCIINHIDLICEKPLLLHPEMDNDFLNYFRFKIDENFIGIEIEGIDSEKRGEGTIKICNLNRESLRRSRYIDIIKPIVKSVKSHLKKFSKLTMTYTEFEDEINKDFDKLVENVDDNEMSHTLLNTYMIKTPENFEKIVCPFICSDDREIVIEAFKKYYKNNLL